MVRLMQLCKKFWILLFSLSLGSFAHAETSKGYRIGLVFDKGGKDDKSFNSAAYQGALKVKKELGYFVKYVEATDDNAFESLLRAFAQKRTFDLVISVGFSQIDPLKKVALQFPNQKFAIVDGVVDLPNVRSLVFKEHEGSFLVGAIAAMTSKTGRIGFIGGIDVPLIRRFEKGYEAGMKYINPKAKLTSNFVGITAEAWNNPAKAKELAMTQYNTGVDVIFSAAGASSLGLFDAAEEKKKFAIGVDSNQNFVKPGFILTSMVKKVDEAVFQTCKDLGEGRFVGGIFDFGLANRGVDYSTDEFNQKILPASTVQKAEEIRKQIISGKLQVPDYFQRQKSSTKK